MKPFTGVKLPTGLQRLFRRDRPFLGLSIDAGEIRAARLVHTADGFRVEAATTVSGPEMDTGGIVAEAALSDALREVASAVGYDGEWVVSALPGMAVIERMIKIPVMPNGELPGAIRFEAEQHIPVPLDDMILRHVVVGEEQNHERLWRTVVAACRRDTVLSFHRAFALAGLTLAAIDLPALALWRYFCAARASGAQRLAIVNVDTIVTQCVLAEGDHLLFSRASPVGSRSLGIDAVLAGEGDQAPEMPALALAEGAGGGAPMTGVVSGDGSRPGVLVTGPFAWHGGSGGRVMIDQLAGEIRRSLEFFSSGHGQWVPEQVVLSGPGARWPELAGLFADELGLEVSVAVPGGIRPGDDTMDPALAVACGLALWGVKL